MREEDNIRTPFNILNHLPVGKEVHSYFCGKGGSVLGSVGLSLSLSVSNITRKVMNGLR